MKGDAGGRIKSKGATRVRAPKGCVFERIRAVDSDSAEEACWNVVHLRHYPLGGDGSLLGNSPAAVYI